MKVEGNTWLKALEMILLMFFGYPFFGCHFDFAESSNNDIDTVEVGLVGVM